MFVDKILELRLATIEKLLEIPYALVARYETKHSTFCKATYDKRHCDRISYGSLMKDLQNADIWPRPKAGQILESISQVAQIIQPSCHYYYDNRHEDCFGYDEMQSSIHDIVSSMGRPMLDSYTAVSQRQPDRAVPTKHVSVDQALRAVFEGLAVAATVYLAYNYSTIAMYALMSLGLGITWLLISVLVVETSKMNTACCVVRLLYTIFIFIIALVGASISWSELCSG